MATTTPNFGWPVPTSTDLVKNGATAIEALGDAIDASLVDLEGGTTGQVLAKASNTDMDFSWVTQDDANAIQNAIVNAKGDIIGASANDVPAITSVGNNGEALYADSAATAGLRYSATPAASNPIINSSMQVAQRGTTFTNAFSSTYTLDRWLAFRGAAKLYNVSQQVTADTTNLPFIQYCARVGRPSGNTDLQTIYYTQSIETLNSRPFAGKVVTLSFYARSGANYSATSNALTLELTTGTGTDQNMISGFTGAASPISTSATLTTTWQRFTFTSSTLSSSMTELGVNFNYTPTGTAGANDYFEITGVQIDISNVALPFRTAGVSYQEELAMCQRYYFRAGNNDTAIYAGLSASGFAQSATTVIGVFALPVTMRTVPSSTLDVSNVGFRQSVGTTIATSAVTLDTQQTSTTIATIYATVSVVTAATPGFIVKNNSGSAYIGFSAEL